MTQAALFRNTFAKDITDSNCITYVDEVSTQYPYFALSKYYALKLATNDTADSIEKAQNAVLFFNNPYLLQAQLNRVEMPMEEDLLTSKNIIAPVNGVADEVVENRTDTLQTDEAVMLVDDELTTDEVRAVQNEGTATLATNTITLQNVDAAWQAENVFAANVTEPIHIEETEIITNNEDILHTVPDELVALENAAHNLEVNIETDEIKTETPTTKEEENLFEPLHATDYFASLGIKYSQLTLTNDKLDKQLKSFTSWLKTMKKVHPDKLAPANTILEVAIQQQAAQSNIDTEIVTEAMAEALVLQGKHTRAIEVYEKLSLLYTSKTAYFATKIDHLKK